MWYRPTRCHCILAPVVVGRRCASLDSAGIFCSGSPAAGWLKLWWNSHLPPISPLRLSDTACLLATTFEALAVSVSSPRGPLTILAAYRPGSKYPSSLFFHKFAVLLEQFALYNAQLVITGDLNLHLEDPSLPASSEFPTIIDQFGLTQHVAEPTHMAGGWLDVVLTRDDCIPTDVRVFPPTASDHGLVTATIPFLCDTPSYLIRQVRDWSNLDRAAFGSALLEIPAVADQYIMNDLKVADVFATYQSAMAEVFERLLPTRQARIRLCGLTPWFNAECRSLRREARRLERLYGRTRAPADRAAWVKYVRDILNSPTGTRSGSTGKPGLLLILNSPSGYGPHSTPCLDVDELTVRLILHLSQRKTT